MNHLPTIYGVTSLNEKGQVVIPADARAAYNLGVGSKLMVLSAPGGKMAIVLMPVGEVEEMMAHMTEQVTALGKAKNADEAE